MSDLQVHWIALAVFVGLFLFVTVLGFVAVRWKPGDLNLLDEWGLGGRRFGIIITWFVVGGDLYTAYTHRCPCLGLQRRGIRVFRDSVCHHHLSFCICDHAQALDGLQALRASYRRRFRA